MYYGTNPLFLDKNRPRKVVFYGRVSTEHEAQLSALENQMQWYEDTAKRFPNWEVVGRYIDEYNLRLIQFDTETAVKPHKITALGAKRQTESRYFCFMEI